MGKRVVITIGCVFCVEIDNEYKCYFQYVSNDFTQLNSTVIRVFKKRYSMDYVPNIEEIISDEVYFYAHAMIRVGVKWGAWYKVGRSKTVGDVENIMFRWFQEIDFSKITKSYRWYVWRNNGPFIFIGEMTDEYKSYELGLIYSHPSIISRIKTGHYPVKHVD